MIFLCEIECDQDSQHNNARLSASAFCQNVRDAWMARQPASFKRAQSYASVVVAFHGEDVFLRRRRSLGHRVKFRTDNAILISAKDQIESKLNPSESKLNPN